MSALVQSLGVAEVVCVQRVAVPQILEGFPAPQARFPSELRGGFPSERWEGGVPRTEDGGSPEYPDRRCRFPKTSATPRARGA